MRILATTLLCLLLSTQICRAQDDAPKAAKASVTGTVLRTDLNQPVADADVILAPETSTWDRTVSVTDSKGSFTFSGLPAGSYRLRVSKPRFVMPSPQLQAEGYRMEVAEGQQLAGVDLKISSGGVVTGKVLDEQGEPVIGATIKLLLPRYKPAGSTLEAATSAQTNDLGEYRLFGISPGRYYLVVHPPGTSKQELSSSRESRAARATTYRRMYYDNALLERDARPLTVAAGTEVSVDFSLTKVRTATVHLTLAIPKKFSDPQGYLGIVPVDSSLLETLEYSDLTGDLSCTFKDVMPGHYIIGGIVEDRQRKDDKEFFGVGAQEIDVAEGLNEVHVPVTSFSAYLTGHIRFDSEKHPPVADLKVFYAPLRG